MVFFVSQIAFLSGAENLKKLDPWQYNEYIAADLFLNADVMQSELEKFDESVNEKERRTLFGGEESDGVELVSSDRGHSLPVEQQQCDSIELLSQKLEVVVPLAELLQKITPLSNVSKIKDHNGPKISGRSPYAAYRYCGTCDVWFHYCDKEGRHKRRKSYCNGYPK